MNATQTEAAERKASAIVHMALANLEALIGPLLNPINEYGDRHPAAERAYIEQPEVLELASTDFGPGDHFPPIYGRVEASPEPAVIFIRPLLRDGSVKWTCSACDGEEPCFHILTLLLTWVANVKRQAKDSAP